MKANAQTDKPCGRLNPPPDSSKPFGVYGSSLVLKKNQDLHWRPSSFVSRSWLARMAELADATDSKSVAL